MSKSPVIEYATAATNGRPRRWRRMLAAMFASLCIWGWFVMRFLSMLTREADWNRSGEETRTGFDVEIERRNQAIVVTAILALVWIIYGLQTWRASRRAQCAVG